MHSKYEVTSASARTAQKHFLLSKRKKGQSAYELVKRVRTVCEHDYRSSLSTLYPPATSLCCDSEKQGTEWQSQDCFCSKKKRKRPCRPRRNGPDGREALRQTASPPRRTRHPRGPTVRSVMRRVDAPLERLVGHTSFTLVMPCFPWSSPGLPPFFRQGSLLF